MQGKFSDMIPEGWNRNLSSYGVAGGRARNKAQPQSSTAQAQQRRFEKGMRDLETYWRKLMKGAPR